MDIQEKIDSLPEVHYTRQKMNAICDMLGVNTEDVSRIVLEPHAVHVEFVSRKLPRLHVDVEYARME